MGIILVDQDMRITMWNRRTEDMRGLGSSEIEGQYLLNLDIGLPVAKLPQPSRMCLSDPKAREHPELKATYRRGRTVLRGITCDSLVRDGQPVDGVILWIDERRITSEPDQTVVESESNE